MFPDEFLQRLAGNIFQFDEMKSPRLPDVVDCHDVRVRQAGGGSGFGQEQLHAIGLLLLEVGAEHFDGTGTQQHVVFGAKHGRHSASAQELLDGVQTQSRTDKLLGEISSRIRGGGRQLSRHGVDHLDGRRWASDGHFFAAQGAVPRGGRSKFAVTAATMSGKWNHGNSRKYRDRGTGDGEQLQAFSIS